MWNIIITLLLLYAIYVCIKYYSNKNCSNCIHKNKCWNKSDDMYCKMYKCEHHKRK